MSLSDHSSSDEEVESRDVIKTNDIRLSQMRRGAQKRGGQSKLKSRYEGLQSYGDMMRSHGLQRMQEGLGKLLSLHSAAELSSLCGCLGLKVQLKGATSKEQILKYATETEEVNEEKIGKILNFMWEGALWEYLHSIGHPIHSMLPDPKQTILRIWIDGGLLDGSNTFIPHFVAREVKKRYEWITSEDIRSRLDKLRICQEAAKVAERKVVSEHDYTNILTYFGQMGELRRMENATREYLISELEIARSRIDSCSDTAKMNRQQLKECEMHFVSVAESLNTKLAYTEATCDTLMQERLTMEKDLQRLSNIMDSYIESEFNREQPGGGSVVALRLKDEEKCFKSIRNLHRKMMTYRNIQNASDTVLRERARGHVTEIDRLEGIIRELETDLNDKINECEELEARTNRAENELKLASRMISKAQLKASNSVHESWGSAFRYAARVNEIELTLRKIKPVIVAGLNHKKNKVLSDVCKMLLQKLPIAANDDEYNTIINNFEMSLEDTASTALRKLFRQSSTLSPDGKSSKDKKDKPGTPGKGKGKASSGGAKKKGAGSDTDTVKSKSSVGSGASSPSKGSKAPGAGGTGKKAPTTSPIKEAKEKPTPKKAEAAVKSPAAKAAPKGKK